MAKKRTVWYQLDNAAKIYPPTASENRAHCFSFSAIINEEVEPTVLKEAAISVLAKNPTFKTKLMKGKFWYYLEENNAPFNVFVETPYYLKAIDYTRNNGYLVELMYIRNRITIKFFHAITDGTGGFNFFSQVLLEYFKLMNYDVDSEGIIRPIDAPFSLTQSDDSFQTYKKKTKLTKEDIKRPYQVSGTPFNYDGCGMITAMISINKIKELSKSLGVSITSYLSGLYLYSVYTSALKDKPHKNKIVTVLVPCNLRKKYGGETMRNFTMFARVTYDFNKKPLTVDECALLAQEQITKGTEVDALDKIIYYNVKTEKNPLIKIAPLFLKNLIMRLAYIKVGENLQTVDFSNIGLVNLPKSFEKYLKHLTFAITPTFSCRHQTGVIGYKDNLYMTFARDFVETRLEKDFIRELTSRGIVVKLFSNYWESEL